MASVGITPDCAAATRSYSDQLRGHRAQGGTVTLLVPDLDYACTTVLHCHIVEHEDIGMMGIWNIAP